MSRLTWNILNAQSVSINHGIGVVAAQGSVNVAPTVATTYTLTAINKDGSASQLQMVVGPS